MSKGFDFIYFQKRGDLCAAACIIKPYSDKKV